MACKSPIYAYQHKTGGKLIFHYNPFTDSDYLPVTIPCGQCIECRKQKAREWANRILMESKYHDSNYFLTLTYDEQHVPRSVSPASGQTVLTLCPEHLTLFWKRLRKAGFSFRYFAAGEYGDVTFRPHYHAILFGLDLTDLKEVGASPTGDKYYQSETINKIWSHGHVTIGAMTWESACYVAQYCLKKQTGVCSDFYVNNGIVPEFVRMSRRPGIGYWYFEEHPDCMDYTRINVGSPTGARSFAPPRYFEKMLEKKYLEDNYGWVDNHQTGFRKAFRAQSIAVSEQNMTNNTSLDTYDQRKVIANAKNFSKKIRDFD